MPFNSDTYHANKNARLAWRYLAQARDIKKRSALGAAYEWEERSLPTLVSSARLNMRLSVLYRQMAEEGKARRKP